MPASQAAFKVAAAVASSTRTNSSPRPAPPKPSSVTATPDLPRIRVLIAGLMVDLPVGAGSEPVRDAPLQGFEQDRRQDDGAGGEALPENLDAGQVEEVAGERDDQHADDGAQHPALSARQARAADHPGCDDLEFGPFAGVGRHGTEPRQIDQPGERGSEADDHEADDLDAVGADAGEQRHG